MKRAIGVLVLLLSLIWVPVAHAQTTNPPATNTPTPTPTPSPTPSPTPTVTPSATDILNAADAADLAKRTVREVETMTEEGGGVTLKEASHGVISYKPFEERLHTTDHQRIAIGGKVKKGTTHLEMIAVKKKIVLRQGHGKWQCGSPLGSTSALVTTLVNNAMNGITIQFGDPATTTINGIPVWNIEIKLDAGALGIGGVTGKVVENAYISQADDTVIRAVATVKEKLVFQIGNSKKTMTLHVHGKDTINYSDYGLPVHIKLPAACGG